MLASTAGQGLPLHAACIPHEAVLQKTDSSSVRSYQLKLVSGLGMGLCLLPSQSWAVWLRPVRACASSSLGSCDPVLLCLEGFLGVFRPYWLHSLSASSSTEFPEPRADGFGGDGLFRTECSLASHPLHCPALGFYICFHHRRDGLPIKVNKQK